MTVQGGLVTDAKSLFDHLGSTGQVPTERQTMLNLMVARDHLESRAYELYWVPTFRQFGDGLTKRLRNLLWEAFCKSRTISLKETEQGAQARGAQTTAPPAQRQSRKEKGSAPTSAAAPSRTAGGTGK